MKILFIILIGIISTILSVYGYKGEKKSIKNIVVGGLTLLIIIMVSDIIVAL